MKRILAILSFVALSVVAQSLTLEEGATFELSYDHTSQLTTKIFTNGVLYRTYAPAEVRLVSTGATNTYAVTVAGLPARNYVFTASVVADGIESDQSNQLAISVKPRKPGALRKL